MSLDNINSRLIMTLTFEYIKKMAYLRAGGPSSGVRTPTASRHFRLIRLSRRAALEIMERDTGALPLWLPSVSRRRVANNCRQ